MHAEGDQASSGYWMYAAAGSGVFYNVGRTAVFRDHREAFEQLPGGYAKWDADSTYLAVPRLAQLAKAAGFDSIQYTHRLESLYLYEIQDVRDALGEVTVCPGPSMSKFTRGGWAGSEPCECTGRFNLLDCSLQTVPPGIMTM